MNVQAVKAILSEQPFKPFRVVMANGHAHEVHRREMAFLTQNDLVVGLDEIDGVPAEFKICSLRNIASIERPG